MIVRQILLFVKIVIYRGVLGKNVNHLFLNQTSNIMDQIIKKLNELNENVKGQFQITIQNGGAGYCRNFVDWETIRFDDEDDLLDKLQKRINESKS